MQRGFDLPPEQIESAREHHDEQMEKGSGCIWCDIGFEPRADGQHYTSKGVFSCTKQD